MMEDKAKKHGINIGIYIASGRKGLFISIGKILAKNNNVFFIARDNDVKRLILKNAPEFSNKIFVHSEYDVEAKSNRIIEEALLREVKYGEYFSMLTSYDRGLGQGYLFNAEKHPHVIMSLWPHKKKLKYLLDDFLFYEHVFDKCKFDLLLGFDRPIILELVAKHYGAYYLTLGVSRFGDRYMWFENNFEEKGLYVDLVKKYLNDYKKGPERIDYEPYKRYSYTANMLDYSYKNAFKLAFKQFIHEIYAHVRRIHKRDSYILFGWIPAILRNSHNYRYYAKNSVRPSDIKRYRLVYFPLNQEPESALLFLSPEFNNSMEIIAWVSKSLPADTLLVIKENPWSFGIRSKRFYKTLLKIPNVVFGHSRVPSSEWIKKSQLVIAITGTAGFEAVYFKKPVLSYGKYQVINFLPTVRYTNNFFTTRDSIKELIDFNPEDNIFEVARNALNSALMDVSFSLPGYEKISDSNELQLDLANIAIDKIYAEYPIFREVPTAGTQESVS